MKKPDQSPPGLFHRFFRWYCDPKLVQYIEGDLLELYRERLSENGKGNADIQFIVDVLLLFRPGIIRSPGRNPNTKTPFMLASHFKVGWRKLLRNKGYSIINIGGLAIGMTVAMFIGLWINDEISFNKYHKNYHDIAEIWAGGVNPESSEVEGSFAVHQPLGRVLRNNYPQYFKHVLKAWFSGEYVIDIEGKKLKKKGLFIEGGVLDMLSLRMLQGGYQSLGELNSIVLSRSAALSIFGNENPINKTLKIDNQMQAKVTGIYEDIPRNNRFADIEFFAPYSLYVSAHDFLKNRETDWDNRTSNVFVQLQPNTHVATVNTAIKDLYQKNVPADFFKVIEKNRPFAQLIPMSTWHLYSEFKNGKPAGGRITLVWLFGIVGVFVLLLACINFINLSTARSEERSREVGVRKAIGSGKSALVYQFLSESLLVVILAFCFSIVLLITLMGQFNIVADKEIPFPFSNPVFWGMAILFIFLTGFIAGLYPAFYLSSFQPVKVLKGVLGAGRIAALPRKVLVVVQFTVSIVLIIGTLIVYKQVQYSRNRPIGYNSESLIAIDMTDPNYNGKHDIIRTELLKSGVVSDMAVSSNPMTEIWNITNGYHWEGKDANLDAEFVICNITPEYGKTVGWEVVKGRDFSRDLVTDTANSIIINEAAARYMGMKDPVGQQLTDLDKFGGPKWTKKIIGVVKDIVIESPYKPVKQAIYFYSPRANRIMNIRINPGVSARDALPKIEAVLREIVPSALFDFRFVDEEYAIKFKQEERVGKLSGVFAALAIFISCLGIFGLASFVAEKRTKEIGIRKVLGASVGALWQMLSKDFVVLVMISCLIAIPVGYFLMNRWLENYEYRTQMSWWIFALTCVAAVVITLLTVSYQAIKAAMMNPVKSLRSE